MQRKPLTANFQNLASISFKYVARNELFSNFCLSLVKGSCLNGSTVCSMQNALILSSKTDMSAKFASTEIGMITSWASAARSVLVSLRIGTTIIEEETSRRHTRKTTLSKFFF